MLQVLVGLALGLVLIAFFIAAMYYVLPDSTVDKALGWFETLRKDLLNTTVGRIIDVLLSPVTNITNLILSFILDIGRRAGPLAGLSVALIGLLRTSWGIFALIDSEKALNSVEGLQRATIILLIMGGVGAVVRVSRNIVKSLFFLTTIAILPIRASNKGIKKYYRELSLGLRLAYLALIILICLFAIHTIATAVEVIRPNSHPAQLFKELDLLDKFYLYVIKDIEIR